MGDYRALESACPLISVFTDDRLALMHRQATPESGQSGCKRCALHFVYRVARSIPGRGSGTGCLIMRRSRFGISPQPKYESPQYQHPLRPEWRNHSWYRRQQSPEQPRRNAPRDGGPARFCGRPYARWVAEGVVEVESPRDIQGRQPSCRGSARVIAIVSIMAGPTEPFRRSRIAFTHRANGRAGEPRIE